MTPDLSPQNDVGPSDACVTPVMPTADRVYFKERYCPEQMRLVPGPPGRRATMKRKQGRCERKQTSGCSMCANKLQ